MQNDSLKTPYMESLLKDSDRFQIGVERLLEKYNVQPVGSGYIDLIVDCSNALKLIEELASLPVAVQELSWWCLCTPESKLRLGCPHGLGGPENRFGPGWFSECVQYPDFVVAEHEVEYPSTEVHKSVNDIGQLMSNYVQTVLPNESFYSQCLHPGLWLLVPDDWKRKHYWL